MKRAPTAQDIESFRRENNITVYSNTVMPPAPFMDFDSSGFPPHILKVISNLNYANPTPIQAQGNKLQQNKK